jgi:hypothetical protein
MSYKLEFIWLLSPKLLVGVWKSKIAKLSCVPRRTITKGATEVHAIKELWPSRKYTVA